MTSNRKKAPPPAAKGGANQSTVKALRESIVDHVLDGIITISEKGIIETFNPGAEKIFGYEANEVIGNNVKMLMGEPYKGEHDGYLNNYMETGEAKIIGIGREVEGRRKDGAFVPLDLAVTEMMVGKKRMFVGILKDITERRVAEARITEQHRLLLELSTPVLKVWDQVVLLPLIGTIDTQRASQIIENLLQSIVANEARVAVIDVTGVPSIDTHTAQHLIMTVSAAEMLGAKVLITGISPVISQTLVRLGVDISTIHAFGPLRAGIAEALRLTGSGIMEKQSEGPSTAGGEL